MTTHFHGSRGKPVELDIDAKETRMTIKPISEKEAKRRGKHVKGKIREEVGKMTGNKKEQFKGRTEQAEGKVRAKIGKAIRKSK
jgi:uncharacterized protein YjbJ (UPF0337 family)